MTDQQSRTNLCSPGSEGCKRSPEYLLFKDVQALCMLAGDQYSGYSSRCKAQQSTCYLKEPVLAGLGGGLSLH